MKKKNRPGLQWPPMSPEDLISTGGLFGSVGGEDSLKASGINNRPKIGKCSVCGKKTQVFEMQRANSQKVDRFCRPCGDDVFGTQGC
ncbi:MAG: hypothetical protein HZA94_02830 [Candidatus Vogelbacteria bacterium]|nr:hypothetical protein [Candidatus Vogelbacteria bacterium]